MGLLSLVGRLSLDNSKLEAGLRQAGASVRSTGASIAGTMKGALAGAFSTAAITSFAKSVVDVGSQIKDLSDRLGVSARDVQEFGLAAKLGGQGSEVFAKALEKIRILMADGKNPLAEFGITMKDMRSGDSVGVLRKLGEAMDSFTGSASQTKALADAFGTRGMGAVVNMLREMRGAKGEAFFSDKDVENLDRAGDAATKLWNNMRVGALKAFEATGEGIHDAISFLTGIDLKNVVAKRRGKRERKGATIADAIESDDDRESAAKRWMRMQDEILEIEKLNDDNRESLLTKEERLNELYKERAELARQLNFQLTDEAVVKKRLEIAKTDAEIIKQLNRASPTIKKENFSPISGGSLQSVGNFLGARTDGVISNKLDKLAHELRMIREKIPNFEGGSFP